MPIASCKRRRISIHGQDWEADMTAKLKVISGDLLEEDLELSLGELCQVCRLTQEEVLELVEYGVAEPRGRQQASWRFRGVTIRRIHRARSLQSDLGVNMAGAALALDLLEELERLRVRLARLEPADDSNG